MAQMNVRFNVQMRTVPFRPVVDARASAKLTFRDMMREQ